MAYRLRRRLSLLVVASTALVVALGFGARPASERAEAASFNRLLGSISVNAGTTIGQFDATLAIFPPTIRLSSDGCNASPDSAVTLDGTFTAVGGGDLAVALLPVGAAARDLSAGSPINAAAVVTPFRIDDPLAPPALATMRFWSLTVQVNRAGGFPGMSAFSVCAL